MKEKGKIMNTVKNEHSDYQHNESNLMLIRKRSHERHIIQKYGS